MKILHHDEDTLTLRPGEAGFLILFGLIFCGVGLMVMFIMGVEHRLMCDRAARNQITCRLQRTLLGLELENKSFNNLRGARLNVGYTRSKHGRRRETYRVILLTGDAELPLTSYSSSSYAPQKRAVEDVNTFVQSPALSHVEISQGGAGNMWLGGLFFLAGFGIMVGGIQSYFTTWTFDRVEGQITHRRETLLGVKINDYPLRDIANAHIGTSRSSKGRKVYRVELLTHAGDAIPLTSVYSGGAANKEKATRAIRAFLQQEDLQEK